MKDENDFYVAIQGIMTSAKESGWNVDAVYEAANDAIDEWLEEEEKNLPDSRADIN